MQDKKIKVICHMMTSLDGKIIIENWDDSVPKEEFSTLYEDCHKSFKSEAWIVGRVTMENDFTKGRDPKHIQTEEPVLREAHIGDGAATSFAIVVDGDGKLGWDGNNIEGDHIIEVLREDVSDAYLNYLREKKISYVFAGTAKVDLKMALEEIKAHFPISTLMLEGGGTSMALFSPKD